ncbi:MAG: hypothetical protein BWZ09_00944 [Alphaproteobacteria bacterium ADurb.BinA305]|nr:MAG: hypothetical protein BWZ09_00944 [Alphaproteobacteria bacterium ADurb.BinA305]
MTQGVLQQVAQHERQQAGVGDDLGLGVDTDAGRCGRSAGRVQARPGVAHRRAQVDRFERLRPRLAGEQQQALGERGGAVGGGDDALGTAAGLVGQDRIVQQHLGIAADTGERGAQLVRQIGVEIALARQHGGLARLGPVQRTRHHAELGLESVLGEGRAVAPLLDALGQRLQPAREPCGDGVDEEKGQGAQHQAADYHRGDHGRLALAMLGFVVHEHVALAIGLSHCDVQLAPGGPFLVIAHRESGQRGAQPLRWQRTRREAVERHVRSLRPDQGTEAAAMLDAVVQLLLECAVDELLLHLLVEPHQGERLRHDEHDQHGRDRHRDADAHAVRQPTPAAAARAAVSG